MISNLETQRENLVDDDEKVRDAKKITIDNTSSIIIHRFVARKYPSASDNSPSSSTVAEIILSTQIIS